YVLRLVAGGQNRSRVDVGQGGDIVADEQVHDVKWDLRDLNAEGTLSTFGVGFKTDDQPAYLDLLELSFSAPDGQKNDTFKDETPGKINVTDSANNPLAGEKVIGDAERSNFARTATTDKNGDAMVAPLANELQKHMVRVEKGGYLTVELANAISESGQSLTVK